MFGAKTNATASKIEFRTGPRGAVRRPYVTFTTADGKQVEAPSVLHREKIELSKGDGVRVSYNVRNPHKVAIHGYDFRLREPVGALLGIALAIVSFVAAVNITRL